MILILHCMSWNSIAVVASIHCIYIYVFEHLQFSRYKTLNLSVRWQFTPFSNHNVIQISASKSKPKLYATALPHILPAPSPIFHQLEGPAQRLNLLPGTINALSPVSISQNHRNRFVPPSWFDRRSIMIQLIQLNVHILHPQSS
jgi:hypothetical protein